MRVTAGPWNVVLVGAWNPAIVTPAWIGANLFEIPDGAPVQVELAIDGVGKFRVFHEGIRVSYEPGRLLIEPEVPNIGSLQSSQRIGLKAIQELGRTPISGTGINFRFVSEQAEGLFLDSFNDQVTYDSFQENGLVIRERQKLFALDFEGHILNLTMILFGNGQGQIQFNFHCPSSMALEIQAWLEKDTQQLFNRVDDILRSVDMEYQINNG